MMAARLSRAMLGQLPAEVARPCYDRSRIAPGIAHIGVGAFHRSHQAEFTDDLLADDPNWGIVGINFRAPRLQPTLGEQDGLYTRLTLRDGNAEPRVIGSIVRTVDSQDDPQPALAVLSDPAIKAVTMTVTEKGYCHRPANGALDPDHPAIVHDIEHPETPQSLPGLLLRALELRRARNAPLTLISCDNIPSNGTILSRVVTTLADRRDPALRAWIEANAAFPGTMVDRIAPATSLADIARLETEWGYRDEAVTVCEPFRQWVIEDRFAGPVPGWSRVGAQIVEDVEPFEILKMRVLNGAQTTLSTLGALCGFEHTHDDMADPTLAVLVERMLIAETLPTLRPVPGISPIYYVGQSLDRLRNRSIRHRNHQIATDSSQKIVQRILNPAAERLRRGEPVELLALSVAGFMAYLIRASKRFGAAWMADDPYAARVAAIADETGRDPGALVAAITSLDGIFSPELAASEAFRAPVASALDGLLSSDPHGFLRGLAGATTVDAAANGRLEQGGRTR